MEKIQAIKLLREKAPNLSLLEAKNLIEVLAPLLQMRKEEINSRIQAINETIRYRTSVGVAINSDDVEALGRLVEERKNLVRL